MSPAIVQAISELRASLDAFDEEERKRDKGRACKCAGRLRPWRTKINKATYTLADAVKAAKPEELLP